MHPTWWLVSFNYLSAAERENTVGPVSTEQYDVEKVTLYYDAKSSTWMISKVDTGYSFDKDMTGKNIVKTEFK